MHSRRGGRPARRASGVSSALVSELTNSLADAMIETDDSTLNATGNMISKEMLSYSNLRGRYVWKPFRWEGHISAVAEDTRPVWH